MLSRYVGHNLVVAQPMMRGEYNIKRGWVIPYNENPLDEGYFIMKINGESYLTWVAKSMFDKMYRVIPGTGSGGNSTKPFLDRLVIERAKLNEKLLALTEFLGGPLASQLADIEVTDLREQQSIMVNYLTILERRISRQI